MSEMKPCPMCGSTDLDMFVDTVQCRECGLTIAKDTADEAIAAWNTRPGEDALQERVDALEWMVDVDEYVIEHEHPVCMAMGNSSKRGQLFDRAAKEYDSIRAAARAAVEKK